MASTPEQNQALDKPAFQPAPKSGAGPDVDAALRLAHAAEHAAIQLEAIASAAAKIESHLAKIAVHYPEPGSAEDVMQQLASRKARVVSGM
jgi:hypothetical protein